MEAQLPEGGFPSGVGVPSATLLVLLTLLAALTAALSWQGDEAHAPQAFVAAQERFADSAARSLGASANQSLNDLRTAVDDAERGDDAVLDKLAANRQWRGAVVLDGDDRALVGARGEPIPVFAIPPSVTESSLTATLAPNGQLLSIAAVVLADGRLVAVSSVLRVPDAGADNGLRQSVFLTTLQGVVVAEDHSSDKPGDETAPLVQRAGQAAARVPGSLLGPVVEDVQAALGYARVAPAGRSEVLDLAVVTVAHSTTAEGSATRAGLVAAGALVLLALLGFIVVRRVVVEPIREARADALAVAGGALGTTVRGSWTAEVARVAAAVEYCRSRLARSKRVKMPATRHVGALTAVVASACAVLAWSAGVVAFVAGPEVRVPGEVVTSLREQTARTGEALRRSLNDGLADLQAVAANPDETALSRLFANQTRYRSVYLVGGDGRPEAHTGRPPLRMPEPPSAAPGLGRQNSEDRIPVLFAQVPVQDGKALVAEFDVEHVAALLGQGGGRVKLVDDAFRTIGANHGYLAFEEVTDPGQRAVLTRAGRDGAVAESGPVALVAATPLADGPVGDLGWSVLAEHAVGDLALPVNETRDNGLLVALLAALLAALALGWHVVIVVRPLKRLARTADAIVGGDHDGVVYPLHHDQIGTIASCLEICRQALTQGAGRLGTVRRPRGAATDETQLMGPADHTQLLVLGGKTPEKARR